MPYIKNGKVVESKGWSFSGFILALFNIIRIFILTIFTGESNDKHIKEYHATKGTWGKGSGGGGGGSGSWKGPNINTFAKPAAAGCAGGAGG